MAFEDAVAVSGIPQERQYVSEHPCECGGDWRWMQQALLFSDDKKPYDKILVTCEKCQKSHEFLFDVSSFFGKSPW